MATINIIESKLNKIVVSQTLSDIPYTSLVINDNVIDNLSILEVRGLQGPPGIPGPSGLSIVGPKGDTGPVGAKGDAGPPGSGISSLTFSDVSDSSYTINTSSGEINFLGNGGTNVTVSDNNVIISSEINSLLYSPKSHTHISSQILDLKENIDDRVADLLKPGTYIHLNYQDQDLNSLTISVTGLTIGLNTQAYSKRLDSISQISVGSGHLLYTTSFDSVGASFISSVGRSFLTYPTIDTQRDALGLGSIATYTTGDFARIVGDNFFQGNQHFGDGSLSRFSAYVHTYNGNNYTISQIDNGKILVFNNANSFINVSFNSSILPGFNCLVAQANSGQVRFSGQIANRYQHTKLVGQFSLATLLKINQDTIILSGDTTLANSGP